MDLPLLTPLSADLQRAAGLPEPWPLAMADRVRFGELDPLQHANNAAYMVWFETLRIRYFEDWGITSYRPDDPRLVIRRAEIDYLAELRLHDIYIATIRCATFRTTSFTLRSALFSNGRRCADFSSVIVMLDPDGSARRPLPNALRDRFVSVDGATPPDQP